MPALPHDPDDFRMSFGEHLEELRRRLIHALLGVLAAAVFTFYYGLELVAWLKAPLMHALKNEGLPTHTATDLLSPVMTYMKVSLIAALVLAAPWVAYQLWQFVAAGLYPSERKTIVGLAPFSALMTTLGILFTYYILLPLTLTFLIHFSTMFPSSGLGEATFIDRFARWSATWDGSKMLSKNEPAATLPGDASATQPDGAGIPGAPGVPGEPPASFVEVRDTDPQTPQNNRIWINRADQSLKIQLDGRTRSVLLSSASQNMPWIGLSEYIDFVLMLLLSVVIAFHLPVAMWIAGMIGLDPFWLGKFRRHCFFGCLVAAAVLTPSTDPFNMSLLAVPLYLLFEVGLLVMRFSHRRRAREKADADA